MRIVHVIDHFYPRLGYQEYFLAKTHSYKHNVLVITSNRFAKNIFKLNKMLLRKRSLKPGLYAEEGVKTLRLPSLFDNPPFNIPWLIGLERAIMDFSPDIVIVHGVVNFSSVRIARLQKKLNFRLIVDDHMNYTVMRKWVSPLYNLFKIVFIPILLKSVDHFIAVTYETKRFMQRIYGIPSKKIRVVPLGVDTERFRYDLNARKDVRRKLGISEDSIIFIYVGKIVPEKGIDLFIKAGIRLCRKWKHRDIKFMIIGGKNEKYFDYLLKMISRENMNNRFIFINTIPNYKLYKYYSAADIGVWPLQCSITILEAIACGLPIIISNKSCALEYLNEDSGFSYKEGDILDLERKMSLLLSDELRHKMHKSTLKYAKKIDWGIIADEFLK